MVSQDQVQLSVQLFQHVGGADAVARGEIAEEKDLVLVRDPAVPLPDHVGVQFLGIFETAAVHAVVQIVVEEVHVGDIELCHGVLREGYTGGEHRFGQRGCRCRAVRFYASSWIRIPPRVSIRAPQERVTIWANGRSSMRWALERTATFPEPPMLVVHIPAAMDASRG